MEPISYIFLYSKYSNSCSKLFAKLEQSQMDLSSVVSLICVDNETIRKRVCEDKKITISSLPCIICMFMNGTVETYEGSFAFQCIDSLIEKLSPPRPPEPIQEQFVPPPPQPAQQPPPQQTRKQAAQTVQRMQADRSIPTDRQIAPRQGNGQVEIPVNSSITSIDEVMNLPEEEPDDLRSRASFQDEEEEENEPLQPDNIADDRHRIIPGPKRLQTADGNYEESEDLFAGERVDIRREPTKTIKPHVKKAEKDPNGIMAKAKELARGRDQVEETINKPGSRGVFTRDNPN